MVKHLVICYEEFLSSIRGAAVTSINVDGVTHEFSAIPGVREDVTEIILNIKQLALKLNDVESSKNSSKLMDQEK